MGRVVHIQEVTGPITMGPILQNPPKYYNDKKQISANCLNVNGHSVNINSLK